MQINQRHFGNYENQDITQYSLSNNYGMSVKIINYGATITSIEFPGKDGVSKEITCGFNQFGSYFAEEYRNNAPYFGCTIGRYCSQIKNACFNLNGENYQLAANCGANNLHGGTSGFDKKILEVLAFSNRRVGWG